MCGYAGDKLLYPSSVSPPPSFPYFPLLTFSDPALPVRCNQLATSKVMFAGEPLLEPIDTIPPTAAHGWRGDHGTYTPWYSFRGGVTATANMAEFESMQSEYRSLFQQTRSAQDLSLKRHTRSQNANMREGIVVECMMAPDARPLVSAVEKALKSRGSYVYGHTKRFVIATLMSPDGDTVHNGGVAELAGQINACTTKIGLLPKSELSCLDFEVLVLLSSRSGTASAFRSRVQVLRMQLDSPSTATAIRAAHFRFFQSADDLLGTPQKWEGRGERRVRMLFHRIFHLVKPP